MAQNHRTITVIVILFNAMGLVFGHIKLYIVDALGDDGLGDAGILLRHPIIFHMNITHIFYKSEASLKCFRRPNFKPLKR